MKLKSNLIDIINKEIKPVEVVVEDGVIASITEIDGEFDSYILPGFIDAHIHMESSMLIPSEFSRLAVGHGSVASVCDPHEIANVLGLSGVEFMMQNAKKTPFKFYFGASPCVPATPFETSGAKLDASDVEKLLASKEIKFLSEVMNFPGVIAGDADMLEKIALANKYNKPIDGHAPALSGDELKKYIDSGISTDHEAFSYEEALEKLQKGMKIIIREGSAAKNYEALHPLIDEHYENLMFCSDDRHPNDLANGHINELVKRSIKNGHDIFKVLQIACINPIKHYSLDVGTLRVGDAADFIVVDDAFDVLKTCIDGVVVYEDGDLKIASVDEKPINKFNTKKKSAKDFYTPKCEAMEVIQAIDRELITKEKIDHGELDDVLKIAVINRYEDSPIRGISHIRGFGIKDGAIASSVAHDSHNIVVVGTDDEYMAQAVNLIIDAKGGVSAVGKDAKHLLKLPFGGIMSGVDGFKVAKEYEAIDAFVKGELGSTLSSPFMTLSFMALLVIPELKLSDKGLFDARSFKFISPCR
ncbi:MAG: adenine deaminase [Campylobacterales bacterium]|nr:adenine deaminase [Campylobacterales bacterium]